MRWASPSAAGNFVPLKVFRQRRIRDGSRDEWSCRAFPRSSKASRSAKSIRTARIAVAWLFLRRAIQTECASSPSSQRWLYRWLRSSWVAAAYSMTAASLGTMSQIRCASFSAPSISSLAKYRSAVSPPSRVTLAVRSPRSIAALRAGSTCSAR